MFVRGLCAALRLAALLTASQLAHDVALIVGAAVLIRFGVRASRAAPRGPGPERAASGDDGR